MKDIRSLLQEFPAVKFTGNDSAVIERVVELNKLDLGSTSLSWCNATNIPVLKNVTSGSVVCPVLPNDFTRNANVNYIETEAPRLYFMEVLKLLFPQQPPAGIAASARVHASASIGEGVYIGENVVIEEGCVIGKNTAIGHNTVIYRNTKIGNHVFIGSNSTIGAAGFGYEKNEKGNYEMLPHIGNVIIEDYAEIANNVCIDRAVLTSTIIRQHAKIDNLVHIAHNVEIGENSLIIANSMVAGSTVVGKNVWVAPSSSILNKIKIGDNAVIGMSAVVLKPVEKDQTVIGNPARPLEKKK